MLGDSEKGAHDRFGHAGVNQGAGSSGGGFSDIFGDVFGDIFGGGRTRNGPARGSDLGYDLQLSLEDAVKGTTVKLMCLQWSHVKNVVDPVLEKAHRLLHVRLAMVRVKFACHKDFSVQQTCHQCSGRGKFSDPCRSCHGQGRLEEVKTLSVKIPAGVDTGDRIRLSGKGEAGPQGGPAGDLFVQMNVRPQDIFVRDGSNLHCEVPISLRKQLWVVN